MAKKRIFDRDGNLDREETRRLRLKRKAEDKAERQLGKPKGKETSKVYGQRRVTKGDLFRVANEQTHEARFLQEDSVPEEKLPVFDFKAAEQDEEEELFLLALMAEMADAMSIAEAEKETAAAIAENRQADLIAGQVRAEQSASLSRYLDSKYND
jgi:hypothetical protein